MHIVEVSPYRTGDTLLVQFNPCTGVVSNTCDNLLLQDFFVRVSIGLSPTLRAGSKCLLTHAKKESHMACICPSLF